MIWEWPAACAIGRPDQRKRLENRERKNTFDELQFVPLRFSFLSRCNDLGMASGFCDRKTGPTQEIRETREEE